MDDNSINPPDEEEIKNTWDGSDNKFVPDSDACEFDEKYSGIKLDYKLNDEEIEEYVDVSVGFDKKKVSRIVKSVIMLVACVLFVVLFNYNKDVLNIILSFVCILVIAVIWLVPYFLKRREINYIKKNDINYSIEIYPDEIEVSEKKKDGEVLNWKFPMNETSELYESDKMAIINTKNKGFLGIPIRVIEPGVLADIQGILITGTKPVEEE